MNGAFDGVFSHAETPEQRRERKEKVYRSAENLAKTMTKQAADKYLDETELSLYGTLRIDMEEV